MSEKKPKTQDFRVWRPNVPVILNEVPPMEIKRVMECVKMVDEFLYRMVAK